jgi:hypothetical protein
MGSETTVDSVLHACADLTVIVGMAGIRSYQMMSGDQKNIITT